MTKRWEFVKKGEQFFFGAPPSPADFWVLIVDNKTVAGLARFPLGDNDPWCVILNPNFYGEQEPGLCKIVEVDGGLTLVEAKDELVRVLEKFEMVKE